MKMAQDSYEFVQSSVYNCLFSFFLSVGCCFAQPLFAGSVKCNCPTISAKGTGNSSCSASESGGNCTVDFNTFDAEIEQQALQTLASVSGENIFFMRFGFNNETTGFDRRAAEIVFSQLGEVGLVDQIMVYALVAAVQNTEGEIDSEAIGSAFLTLRENASSFSQAFMNNGFIETIDGVTVSNGCMEFRNYSGELWAMYKAFWSENAASPQCGGQ